jgi:hypothetical protein
VPWWRKLLAILGFTSDARVRVRAPGIEVVLTGSPDLVRSVLAAVKHELSEQSRRRSPSGSALPRGSTRAPQIATAHTESQLVLPSDLDEMDSPYAIPEHRTVPPDGETPVETPPAHTLQRSDEPEPELTAIDVRTAQSAAPVSPLVPPQIAEPTTDAGLLAPVPRAPSLSKKKE